VAQELPPQSQGLYRLPFADGLAVRVFDDFATHPGNEDAIGCAMLQHVHFEVAIPGDEAPIDSGGFLIDNEGGKREPNPRFCGIAGGAVVKGSTYRAAPC
jgi:hypothetical protein